MFKKKKKDNTMAKVQETNINAVNHIVEGTTIIGDIQAEQSIRIDGTQRGNLTTKGRAIIGKTGKVSGNIVCNNADIEGSVDGKMVVSDLLSLKSTAIINGEVNTSKLAIEPGAILNATCDMSGKHAQHGSGGQKEKTK
jgi:cytoskeletal protein CcmA (bactofilin family)